MSKRVCPQCGKRVKGDQVACPGCGLMMPDAARRQVFPSLVAGAPEAATAPVVETPAVRTPVLAGPGETAAGDALPAEAAAVQATPGDVAPAAPGPSSSKKKRRKAELGDDSWVDTIFGTVAVVIGGFLEGCLVPVLVTVVVIAAVLVLVLT